MDNTKYKTHVINDKILGRQENDKKLYMIVWNRTANFGIIYCWAKSELDALNYCGFSPKFVEHTVVEIDPGNMPVKTELEVK